MDEKTIKTLEYFKVLDHLSEYAAFSYSEELAHSLTPTNNLEEAQRLLKRTSEAAHLMSENSDISIGGARDIRVQIEMARRHGVLEPEDILKVKDTLVAGRELARTVLHLDEPYPQLKEIADRLSPPPGLVDIISQTISDHGEVLDQASQKLANTRRELKISYDRLLGKLQQLINDPKIVSMLQEPIITQRNGRYVIPLRAEFKGRIRAIIHDQSASGATLFIEPVSTVDLNNQLHELQLAERDEIRRILTELSMQIGKEASIILAMLEALGEFDLALMCAKYAYDLNAAEPILIPFRECRNGHPGSTIRLTQARHPLLDQKKAVPIDVVLDEETFVLVITGPNTGGKTVSLKTIGLLSLMAQTGLHIPAQSGSVLSIFDDIFADIGDEQSIEQSLSTFSGHITNIVRILQQSNEKSLVILDELGAGTDPQEGAALARALLAHLVESQTTCLIATHYPELKFFAHTTPGVMNASMEFNIQTLQPTYHLTLGLPGRSNALLIAEHLGMPTSILENARTDINPEDLKAEDLLDEIHHQRDLTRQAQASAERTRREAETIRAELNVRLENIEEERIMVLENARQQAQAELDDMRNELKQVRRKLGNIRQPLDKIKELEDKTEKLEAAAQVPIEVQHQDTQPAPRPLRTGERIYVRSLKMEGRVMSIGESDVEVQLGALRVRASLSDLQRPGEAKAEAAIKAKVKPTYTAPVAPPERREPFLHPSPGMELDLRGKRADEALDELERYLQDAYLAGLPFVRIIHGKGTGRLREEVRKALRQSQMVSSWTVGKDEEGGDGVTVARISTD